MSPAKKRRQITFRIGSLCERRLRQVAELFDVSPAHYVKALLYKDLGIFNEPLDRRRRRKKHRKVRDWELHHKL